MNNASHFQADDPVYAVAASPTFAEDGLCFAARASGLTRSVDGGRTWHDAYASLDLQAALTATCVSFSPDYARDQTIFAGAPGGALRSSDGGKHWTVAALPSPPPFVTRLVVAPSYRQDGLVFAASMEDGVLRSWDRGRGWAGWNFGLLDLNIFGLAASPSFADDETLFAGAESGVFRSTNGGRAWRETPFPMELGPVLSLTLSPDFSEDRTLFAGTEAHGLMRSTDAGESWHPLLDGSDGPVNELIMDDDGDLWAIVGDGVMRTSDGGQTWTVVVTAAEFGGIPSCMAVIDRTAGARRLLMGSQAGHIRLLET